MGTSLPVNDIERGGGGVSAPHSLDAQRTPSTHLDTIVTQIQTKLDPLLERLLRLVRLVNIPCLPTLHPTLGVIDFGIDHSIPDGFRYDIFRILFRIEMKFQADILQRDPGVGEGDHPERGLDDVMTKTEDEGVSSILNETLTILIEYVLERFQIPNPDG
jgi:hypothetical protein